MKLRDAIAAYGTSEGVSKGWDTRGRGKKEGDSEMVDIRPQGMFGPGRQVAVKVGSKVSIGTWDRGIVRGKITGFGYKDNSRVVDWEDEKGGKWWAYTSQIKGVHS